ncbi:hypothetical protein ACLB2K_028995 [Fragaria x ananassa]
MESTDSSSGSQQPPPQPNLPPGFRFHPTDEELVVHYLKKKASSAPLPVAIIAEVDLYKFDPWQLPEKATFGEQEWYFFSPRDRKYPNGARPNRAATSGYWKATGTDKPVLSSTDEGGGGTRKVGVKKALVFYRGKPPKGIKTNWIMHEYRLADNNTSNKPPPGCHDLGNKKNSLRLDDWVLCRIYKKNNTHRPMDQEDSMDDMMRSSFPLSNLHRLPPKSTTSTYGQFMDNDHNFYDGMVSSEGINTSASFLPNSGMANRSLPLKRGLPNLYWNHDQEDEAGLSRRLHLDNSESTGNGSIATLLSQLPQTPPPLHQQPMLGSQLGGDALFRSTQYQLPGMNWYS